MKLTQNILKLCWNEKISLEALYLLWLLVTEERIWEENLEKSKLEDLICRGLLEPSTMKPSEAGRKLVLSLFEDEPTFNGYSKNFQRFWDAFPASDAFRHWPQTRKIKTSKKDTYKAYLAALEKGYEPAFLQSMLEFEVAERTNAVGKDNPFKYMKGSFRWLEDQAFLEVTPPAPIKFANDTLL